MELTLQDYIKWVKDWKLKAREVFDWYLQKAKEQNWQLNAFVRFHEDYIDKNFDNLSELDLKWAAIWIKDNFLTNGYISSCGSKMLENFVSPYSSTCFENLEKAGGCILGKTNMDEFAMWSSTENSYFWPTKNPYWQQRIPWWSSGGSAVAVASDLCIAALGTDTGGSIRQPASMCGVVGFKPTYWRISRYWIQAMASSLDQAWTFTKDVEDCVLLNKYLCWKDTKDATSVEKDDYHTWDEALQVDNLKWFKIAVANEFFQEWLDVDVKNIILEKIEQLKSKWATVDYVDFPFFNYALSVYYIVMPAELSTNLSRFDWIRFGLQKNTFDFDDIYQYYSDIRNSWFWDESKRRIILGTYVLSAGYYDAYYLRAQKVRNLIKKEYDKIFGEYDAMVWPVSPSAAWKLWEKVDDPLKMYLSDVYTMPVNLAGLPAISVPAWQIQQWKESLPVWFHIVSWQWQEDKIFAIANNISW